MLNGPLAVQLQVLWHVLQGFFKSSFSEGLGAVVRAAAAIVDEISYLGGVLFSLREIYFLIKEKNLTFRQKIIPFLGTAVASIFQLVIFVLLCAAMAVFMPPFFFVASILNVFRNVGFYIKENTERNNLRTLFKDEKGWYNEIEQLDLTPQLCMEFKLLLHREHFDKQAVHDLCVRLANHVVNQESKDKQELRLLLDKLRKGEYVHDKKAELKARAEIKSYEDKIRAEFKTHYKPLFRLLKKKQRLNYLDKELKNRIKIVGLSVGLMLISAAVFGVSIAAPPAAPFIFGVLGLVAAGVSVGSAVISTRLSMRDIKEQKKVSNPKCKIREAIVPQIWENVSAKEKEKIRKNLIFSSSPSPPKISQGEKPPGHSHSVRSSRRLDL